MTSEGNTELSPKHSALSLLKRKINEQARTLHYLFIIGLLILLVCQAAANYWIIMKLVLPDNQRTEQAIAERSMDQQIRLLTRERKFLHLSAQSLASLDQASLFVTSASPEYIADENNDRFFIDHELNLVAYFDRSGRLVWQRALNRDRDREIHLPDFPVRSLLYLDEQRPHTDTGRALAGIILFERGAMLIDSGPIIDHGPDHRLLGTMVIGRLLCPSRRERNEDNQRVHLHFHHYDRLKPPAYDRELAHDLLLATSYVFRKKEDRLLVYTLLPDYQGRATVVLEANVNRFVTLRASRFHRYLVVASLLVGLVIFFLGVLFHQRIVHYLSNITQLAMVLARSGSVVTEDVGLLPGEIDLLCQEGLDGQNGRLPVLVDEMAGAEKNSNLWEISIWLAREVEERGRAAQSLRAITNRLEKLVQDRTTELSETNKQLKAEIRERRLYEEKLEKYQKRLRSVSSEIMAIEDRQRRQIAMDLHDQIGQSLSVSRMSLDAILAMDNIEEIHRQVERISAILQQTLQDTRTLTFELCPPVLHELGLAAALEWLTETMAEKYELRVKVECPTVLPPMQPPFLSLVFRSLRELLMNVVRHARTDEASVTVRMVGDYLHVHVSDRGIGFNAGDSAEERPGFGLFSIQERVKNIGGVMSVESTPGAGATVTLILPIEPIDGETFA